MARIAVIAGVRSEADILKSVPDLDIGLSGARSEIAEAQIARLLQSRPDGLLSFGTAGGLNPNAAPGTLIVAEAVVDPGGVTRETDGMWCAAICGALGVAPCLVAGADAVVDVVGKKRLRDATGATAIDMESHIAARLASQAGVPFAVLRAVIDPADRNIPAWIGGTVRPSGGLNYWKLLAGLLLHPEDFGTLRQLGKDNAEATATLRGAVGALGPGFGFPG